VRLCRLVIFWRRLRSCQQLAGISRPKLAYPVWAVRLLLVTNTRTLTSVRRIVQDPATFWEAVDAGFRTRCPKYAFAGFARAAVRVGLRAGLSDLQCQQGAEDLLGKGLFTPTIWRRKARW